ncbi:MAG TPA: replication-relaxation family protein [Bdellovibrionota bacterium]|nr:replication-relaxation family protein [Bdellovibrionota bacterium]
MSAIESKTEERKMRLNESEKDYDLLRVLSEYPTLNTSLLGEILGRNLISLRARLRRLKAEHWVASGVQPWGDRKPAGFPDDRVWRLGLAGIRKAKELDYLPPEIRYRPEWSPKNSEHDLGIARFHYALSKLGILSFWKQWPAEVFDNFQNSGKTFYVKPDGFFGIQDKSEPTATRYFLEWERSNPRDKGDVSSLVRKIAGYSAYLDKGYWERWGQGKTRILFVMRSERRCEGFLQLVREISPKKKFFLAATIDDLLSRPGEEIVFDGSASKISLQD